MTVALPDFNGKAGWTDVWFSPDRLQPFPVSLFDQFPAPWFRCSLTLGQVSLKKLSFVDVCGRTRLMDSDRDPLPPGCSLMTACFSHSGLVFRRIPCSRTADRMVDTAWRAYVT